MSQQHTLEFVQTIHDLMLAEAFSLQVDGMHYWMHYTCAVDDLTSERFEAFYLTKEITADMIIKTFSQCDQQDIEKSIDKHRKIVRKINSGKVFNSYTGRMLMTDRKTSFMNIVSKAVSVLK